MEARKNDFEERRLQLDLWALSWDASTENKLRYFDGCLPANGEKSMRKAKNWGTDPNRRLFIQEVILQLQAEDPEWRQNLQKTQENWEKKHLQQVTIYLQFAEFLKMGNAKQIQQIKNILLKQQTHAEIVLKSLEKREQKKNAYKAKLIANREQKLLRRRQYEEKKRTEKVKEMTHFDELFDINLDLSTEDILKLPIVCLMISLRCLCQQKRPIFQKTTQMQQRQIGV